MIVYSGKKLEVAQIVIGALVNNTENGDGFPIDVGDVLEYAASRDSNVTFSEVEEADFLEQDGLLQTKDSPSNCYYPTRKTRIWWEIHQSGQFSSKLVRETTLRVLRPTIASEVGHGTLQKEVSEEHLALRLLTYQQLLEAVIFLVEEGLVKWTPLEGDGTILDFRCSITSFGIRVLEELENPAPKAPPTTQTFNIHGAKGSNFVFGDRNHVSVSNNVSADDLAACIQAAIEALPSLDLSPKAEKKAEAHLNVAQASLDEPEEAVEAINKTMKSVEESLTATRTIADLLKPVADVLGFAFGMAS